MSAAFIGLDPAKSVFHNLFADGARRPVLIGVLL
jgi:hypothetical protein